MVYSPWISIVTVFDDMKVILLKDVKSLGRQGSVVEVSDGHARNFLFPQNLAVQATAESLERMRQREAKAKRIAKKGMASAGVVAQKLEGFELTLKEKVSDGGKLYAAVTPKLLAAALKKKGFAVEDNMIELGQPIKEVGERQVTVNLPHGFEARITVHVEEK